MKNFLATILALSASAQAAIAIPAMVVSTRPISISQAPTEPNKFPSPTNTSSKNTQDLGVNTFAQRSINLAKQTPKDAIGFLIVDLDRGSWQALENFQIPAQSPFVAVNKLFDFAGLSSQFSFVEDIQPWLGTEMAIAFLGNAENKAEISVAAMSVVKDNQQFEAFIKKLKNLDLPKPTETLYQNVKILEWQLQKASDEAKSKACQKTQGNAKAKCDESEDEPKSKFQLADFGFKRLAIANLPSGVVIIASDRQAIQKMINQSSSESQEPMQSLADDQLFLRSLNNPLWNRSLIAGYGDFKGLGQLAELWAADLPETTEIPGFSRAEYIQGLRYTLSQYSSMDLFTWLTPKGLRSQSNSYFSEVRSPQPKNTETRDRLLSYLPLNIYGAITSRNLNRQWQWFVEESKLQSSYKIIVEGVRMLNPLILGSGLDLDIEKDIISWIDGEYALVAFPSAFSPFKEVGVDLTIGALIRTSKPEIANASLDKLTKHLASVSKDFIQVKKRQVGATLLTSFEIPDDRERGKTQSVFAYGWRDQKTLLLTLGSSTASAFVPTPKLALADSEDFRDAIADMPQPNFGYFYVNANAIAKQFAQFLLFTNLMPNPDNSDKPAKPEVPKPILKAINKLGGAVFVYSETSDRFQSDFFLGIKP